MDTDRMQELIGYVSRSLVDDPDAVEVTKVEGDQRCVFALKVSPDDLGKVIGKKGRTARALRTLLAFASSRTGKHAVLEIVD